MSGFAFMRRGLTKTLACFLAATLMCVLGLPLLGTRQATAQSSSPAVDIWMTNGTINAIATSGTTTYIGGDFSRVGPCTGCGVPVDATTAQPVSDFQRMNIDVDASVPDGSGGWFVGGSFDNVGGVPRNGLTHILADGSLDLSWVCDTDAGTTVYALALSGNTLYAGGSFTTIKGEARSRIAAIDALTGDPLDTWNPGADDTVFAIALFGSTVFVGGSFTEVGGLPRKGLAHILADGSADPSWVSDTDDDETVYALALYGTTLYAGGDFTHIKGLLRGRLAAVDTTNGDPLGGWGGDANGTVFALANSGPTIYVGGSFSSLAFVPRNGVGRFLSDGSLDATWDPDTNGSVYSLAPSGSGVYLGGYFSTLQAGAVTRNRIAEVDATTGAATTWDPNVDTSVFTVSADGTNVFVGGMFSMMGGVARNRLAAIDSDQDSPTYGQATSWDPDVNGNVYALVVEAGTVYVGGQFTALNHGADSRQYLAAVNATSGVPTGWDPEPDGFVFALAASGSTVYAGGWFDEFPGGITRSGAAAIDATTGVPTDWDPDPNGPVDSFAISGNTIYAGGMFTSFKGGTVDRSHLAAISDDSSATILAWDPDAGDNVSALAVEGSTVFAGGDFTTMMGGTVTRNHIAAINAVTGVPLGNWNPDVDSRVAALAVRGDTLYLGGDFSSLKGGAVTRYSAAAVDVATGEPTPWDPNVGTYYYNVYALATNGSTVFVGGNFDTVGGNNRRFFAGFVESSPTVTSVSPPSGPNDASACTLAVTGDGFLDAPTSITLTGPATIEGTAITFTDPQHVGATFNLAGRPTGSYGITVTNPDGGTGTMASAFTITPHAAKPVVSGISPNSGPVGTRVTVNGSNFGATRGNSTVTIGGVKAAVVSWSDSKIVVTVPRCEGGAVVVTTGTGSSNADKIFTVVDSNWYLAEGCTAWGFSTYITIENPNTVPVNVRITYMDPNATGDNGKGIIGVRAVTLPPGSQTTVDPREDIGDTDFSTRIECAEPRTIAVDRTMYWTGTGAPCSEAHNSVGVTSPSTIWYLPEGSSNWGFETWTLVENPNATEARVRLTYMTEDAGPLTCDKTIPAFSRATYSMQADIGSHDSSVEVASDLPVIAECSQYRNSRREGSCSVGTTTPANDFYLAEGTTAWGFTTYLLIQNPNDAPARVTVFYLTPAGPVQKDPFTMPANSRKTIRVNDVEGVTNTDTSIQVYSPEKIIAERSMYWIGGPDSAEVCHASIGLASPHRAFYLPDGQTSKGRQTYTLVQNPNDTDVDIRVSYLPAGGGSPASFTDSLPPNTRRTYNMATLMRNGRAAVMVQVTDGAGTVVVERSMYWNARGTGTDTIGGFSD